MSRPEKMMIDRLGTDGLSRVLVDLMDQPRLVRLANACGLKYPGMRTQSQDRRKIIDDLVDRTTREVSTRKAVYRALHKETRPASKRWAGLSDAEREAFLSSEAYLSSNGNLGRHLFLLAIGEPSPGPNGFKRLLELNSPSEPESAKSKTSRAPSTRDVTRLEKKVNELQKKVNHLDQQLTKSRESVKTAKKDLIKTKGELAESRMLVERVRRDLAAAERSLEKLAASTASGGATDAVEKIVRAVRKLSTEQKKLVHSVAKLAEPPAARTDTDDDRLSPIVDTLDRLRRDVDAGKRRGLKEAADQARRLEELRGDVGAVKKAVTAKSARRPRNVKGPDARVGVFIDVQNMYYAARRLKGKLDFDALMQGALAGRRMIHAAAYVVESKEIDQSGFIAVLEQRGIEVRRKNLRVRVDGSSKGDWDIELVLDILDNASDLDIVVLVSGDGDFTSLVRRVRRMGQRVEVFGFPRNTAKSLIEAADLFQPLDRRFMIYPPRSAKPRRPAAQAEPQVKPKT